MSIHPSLSSSSKHRKQRSVLKRSERLKTMLEKGTFKEGDDVFGLPKIKLIKITFKKEKAEKAAVEGAAASGAEAAAGAPAAGKASAAKASATKAPAEKSAKKA